MYFTQALTVALSLSAAAVKAAPVPGSQKDTSNLVLRSVHESQIAVRSVGISDAVSSRPLQARGLDPVTHLRRAIDLRFGNVDPKARDLAMVTELHRRGLLDQLIAALRDLIITLLGKGGGMTRRQASTEQLEQAIHQVTCILDALFGNTDSDGTCADVLGGAANSTNATGTASNRTVSPLEKKLSALGAQLRNGTSITEMVDDYMAGKQGSASTAAQASKAVPAAAKATGTKKADKKDKPSTTLPRTPPRPTRLLPRQSSSKSAPPNSSKPDRTRASLVFWWLCVMLWTQSSTRCCPCLRAPRATTRPLRRPPRASGLLRTALRPRPTMACTVPAARVRST